MPCSMWPPPNTRGIDGMLAVYSVATPVWDSFTATLGDPGVGRAASSGSLQTRRWPAAHRCGGDPGGVGLSWLVFRASHLLTNLSSCRGINGYLDRHLANLHSDFGIFVRFAKRHLKSQKYQSFVLQDDGSFLARMVPGPACFAHRQASYRVLRTMLVMTGIISLAKLMEWKAMVERLNRQYQGCWGLVAAAEDRGRGVHGQEACQGEAGDGPRAPAPLGWDEGC